MTSTEEEIIFAMMNADEERAVELIDGMPPGQRQMFAAVLERTASLAQHPEQPASDGDYPASWMPCHLFYPDDRTAGARSEHCPEGPHEPVWRDQRG